MSTSPTDYEPRYVDLGDVPIEVQDSYSPEDKREALFQAESQIDSDRAGRLTLLDDETEDITNLHIVAIINLATHYLVRSATSNQDVTLGDLDDGGEQTKRHADEYKLAYDEIIEQLAESGPAGQTGVYYGVTGSGTNDTAVNTGTRHDLRYIDDRLIPAKYLGDDE